MTSPKLELPLILSARWFARVFARMTFARVIALPKVHLLWQINEQKISLSALPLLLCGRIYMRGLKNTPANERILRQSVQYRKIEWRNLQ